VGFLRKLLGGGGQSGDKDGMYFYVRSAGSGEVIKIRLHRFNDLSQVEGEQGYYVRKVIVGEQSFERIEAEFYFDQQRKFTHADVSGGTLVEEADYETWLANRDKGN
jgi:gamma-glutamylcyclotransferase (GGCT)/AIG2-like uncharacterized protein YtfP